MELTSSPGRSPVNLSDCIEELVKFALQSHIDGILLIDLGLSKEFCSYILNENLGHLIWPSSDSYSQELYQISLHKHLASALYELILSKTNVSSCKKKTLFDKDCALEQNVELDKLVIDEGTELLNILKALNFELHVQEPFFKQLRDGQKTVEGRCAVGDYNRMEAGALILFNKCIVLEVQDVHHYPSFSEMLKAETLGKVLPGVKTIEDGNFTVKRKKCPMVCLPFVLQNQLFSHTIFWPEYYQGLVRRELKAFSNSLQQRVQLHPAVLLKPSK